jgi:hypothetical protein
MFKPKTAIILAAGVSWHTAIQRARNWSSVERAMRKRIASVVFGMAGLISVTANGAVNSLYQMPFQALSPTEVVIGSDRNLWLEHAPFVPPRPAVPPNREQIDGNTLAFQALSETDVVVLGLDHNLWLEHAPFGPIPPQHREQIDGNALAFQALSPTEVVVLGIDGNLWLEHAPFVPPRPAVPPNREQIDGNVQAFQALSSTEVVVLGKDGNLWLEHAPFGPIPPQHREQIDGNALSFQALSSTEVVVLGKDGNLWLEHAPFVPPRPAVPPNREQIDGNAEAFQALSSTEVVVLGIGGNLWLEHAPFGPIPPQHREQIDANVAGPRVTSSFSPQPLISQTSTGEHEDNSCVLAVEFCQKWHYDPLGVRHNDGIPYPCGVCLSIHF